MSMLTAKQMDRGMILSCDIYSCLQATVYIYELIDEEVKVEKVEFSKDD
jgi:hypothetical protein